MMNGSSVTCGEKGYVNVPTFLTVGNFIRGGKELNVYAPSQPTIRRTPTGGLPDIL